MLHCREFIFENAYNLKLGGGHSKAGYVIKHFHFLRVNSQVATLNGGVHRICILN